MSISAFRETSFPSGRDKLLIGPARAGGSHGGPDALAPPELPEALDWPERVPVWESVHGPRLAGFALKAVGYAFAIVADGLTFFFSAGLMARIATPETVPAVS